MADIAQTSVYFTTEDREIVAELQQRTGLKRSEVIRLAVHRMYNDDDGRAVRLLEIAEELKKLA